jgi:hypothetical protein
MTTTMQDLLGALHEVSQTLSGLDGGGQLIALKNGVAKVGTDIQYEVRRVADWFRRTRTSEEGQYDVSLAIEIAFAVIGNLYPHVKLIRSIKSQSSVMLKGFTRQPLVDVMLILVDNVAKHSNLGEPHVEIEAALEGSWLVIRCRNEVGCVSSEGPPDIRSVLKERIAEIQQQLKGDGGLTRVRTEGRSGFQKIAKIVKVDLGSECDLKLLLSDDDHFEVEVRIEAQGIVYASANN